jgi:hypothetical protein
MMMKKTVTHFVSLALYRFTVLCSGKGNDDGKGKDGSREGNDNGKKEKEDGAGKGDDKCGDKGADKGADKCGDKDDGGSISGVAVISAQLRESET